MVPYFDPVPIEVPYGFGLVRGFGRLAWAR
jgi:hypothetical protein